MLYYGLTWKYEFPNQSIYNYVGRRSIMSKGTGARKEEKKKKATKTIKEKRAEKKAKKET